MNTLYDIPIIYEDNDFMVLNKPAGIVIHEGAGETGKTLVDLLLEKYPEIKNLDWEDKNRIGIVHRLDKDTSGLIIVAKNPETQKLFQEQFKSRKVKKTYLALVLGNVQPQKGEIKIFVRRHPQHRRKMTVSYLGEGKPAVTKYTTINHFHHDKNDLTLLEVTPETGRMHQIRVHLKHKGYPVIGDQTYNTKESKEISKDLGIGRQFLHAYKLEFIYPDGKKNSLKAELPNDLDAILKHLK